MPADSVQPLKDTIVQLRHQLESEREAHRQRIEALVEDRLIREHDAKVIRFHLFPITFHSCSSMPVQKSMESLHALLEQAREDIRHERELHANAVRGQSDGRGHCFVSSLSNGCRLP